MINARAPRWLQSFSEASATTTAISVRAALSSYVHCLLPTWRLWPPCAVSARCPWWRVDLYIWPPEDLGDVPQDVESQCLTSSSTIMGDSNCPIFTSATQSIRDGRRRQRYSTTARYLLQLASPALHLRTRRSLQTLRRAQARSRYPRRTRRRDCGRPGALTAGYGVGLLPRHDFRK